MRRCEIEEEVTHGRAEGVAGDKHGDDAQAVCFFWNEQARRRRRRRRRLKREKEKCGVGGGGGGDAVIGLWSFCGAERKETVGGPTKPNSMGIAMTW
jgi:hypothetical protein